MSDQHPFRAPEAPTPPTPPADPLRRLRLLPRMWGFVLAATLGTQLLARGHLRVGGALAAVGFVGLLLTVRRIDRG